MSIFSFFKNLFKSSTSEVIVSKPEVIQVQEKEVVSTPLVIQEFLEEKIVLETQEEDDALYLLKMSLFSKKSEESDKKLRPFVGMKVIDVEKELATRYQGKTIIKTNIKHYKEESDIWSKNRNVSGDNFNIVIYTDNEDNAIILIKSRN